MKRLFIATKIELNKDYQSLLQQFKAHCRHDQIAWISSEQQHLTLRFIGKTPEDRIDQIKEMMHRVGEGSAPFELTMNKLGVFGSRYAPTVLWAGFSHFEPFAQLFQKIEPQLLDAGFEKSYGNFVPHITLGRIKKVDSKKHFWDFFEQHKDLYQQTIPIREIILFQSRLTQEGSVYKVLHKEELKGVKEKN